MPGVNSPDFLPSFVLQGILDSARGPLHALADAGEALDGEWISMPYVPEAQLGYAIAALRPGDVVMVKGSNGSRTGALVAALRDSSNAAANAG